MISLNDIEKAVLLVKDGKINEAQEMYDKMLEEEPDNAVLLSAAGLLYIGLKDYDKAGELLNRACELNKSLGTLSALGVVYYKKGDYKEAAKILEEALSYGETVDVYDKLILSLFNIREYQKAVNFAEIMYQKYPNNQNSVANMVKAYTQSGKLKEAELLCVNYLKEHQDAAPLWVHLGFLKELIYSDDEQARQCFQIAYDLGHTYSLYNIAVSYQKQGNYAEAERCYRKIIEGDSGDEKNLNEGYTETLCSLGMCLLAQRKFKEGYDLFFKRPQGAFGKLTENPWTPDKEFEKEVVVISDQGYGDHIQFVRYLPFLKEKTEKIYLAVRGALKELFKSNYPEYEYITYDEINPKMQSVYITDLAYALNIDFDHIPFSGGYLTAAKADIKSDKLKVGLCWEAGSAGIRTMINRTINIRLLEPFLNLDNVQIYSFQVQDTLKGNERYPQMINLAKDFKDFSDTAKALKSMDLLITVDTAVAHLAGAIGVKTFLMLPYATDWRWFSDTKTTPWYDSIEIFKQDDPISWEKPIKDIICRLKEYSL